MKNKILVADDTKEILSNLSDFLIMEGYEVSVARNGKEALAHLHLEIPDLIITDLLMPEMTGFELIKELRSRKAFSKIPVLIFSARPLTEDQNLDEIGADMFILKPASPEIILSQTCELLKRKH